MKAMLLGLVTLGVGIGIGCFLTSREFAGDVLPVDVTLASSGARPGGKIGPKAVVVNGEQHDFGTMERNGHGQHVFIVRNEGDAVLELATGEPTCKCTVFSVDKDRVKPGDKANIALEWNVKTSEGQFEQSGPLNTNDRRRPTITLTIRGQVIDTVRAERTDIHFHDISANEPVAASINIYAFRGTDLRVLKHDFTNAETAQYFDVSFAPLGSDELAKEQGAKAGVKMTVQIKSGLPLGRIEQSVLVTTNQNDPAALTINLFGNVVSDIRLAEGAGIAADKLLVSLGPVDRSEGKKQTVYLIVKGPHRDKTDLSIVSYEPTVEFSAALGEPIRSNPRIVRYPLILEVPPDATPVNHLSEGAYAQVRLATTHPDVPQLTVKVRYAVKE